MQLVFAKSGGVSKQVPADSLCKYFATHEAGLAWMSRGGLPVAPSKRVAALNALDVCYL
jgi:hypothetical protein